MRLSWLSKKSVSVLLHIFFWVVLFSLPSLFRPSHENNVGQHEAEQNTRFFYQYLINCCSWIFLFYFNSYVLIPVLVYRKRYLRYILSLIPLLAVLFLLNF